MSSSKRKSQDKNNTKPDAIADQSAKKQKVADEDDTEAAQAATSTSASPEASSSDPRAQFDAVLDQLITQYPNHRVMILGNLPGEDSEDEEEEEETSEEKDEKKSSPSFQAYDKLPRVVIPMQVHSTYKLFRSKFMSAIDADDGFMMTSTHHSSIVMELFTKQLSSFNTAFKQVDKSPSTSIPKAFQALFAATIVMASFSFWYCDTEEIERAQKLTTKIFKGAWERLLERTDQELGLVEARTRTDLKRWLSNKYNDMQETMREMGGE